MQEGEQGAQMHGGLGPIGYTNVQFPGPLVKKRPGKGRWPRWWETGLSVMPEKAEDPETSE